MANTEDNKKELETGFTVVQRKNMKRTKPTQPIYRPGNGPLRKSNTIEDSESDTNLVLNSKRPINNDNGECSDSLRHRSEGNSPRERVSTIRNFGESSGDTVFNDNSRRPKKPEKRIYVPRPLAQARDNSVQPLKSNSYSNFNGKTDTYIDKNKDVYNNNNSHQTKSYVDKRSEIQEPYSRWDDASGTSQRQRQVSEPRGAENSSSSENWNRTRDTRSVEPSVAPRNFNSEKIQTKPPTGRRHSTVGLEFDERQKNLAATIPNFHNLPPRFQKKYLNEHNLPEENWDGSSITFQSHPNFKASKTGPSYYHPGSNYNTLPNTQHFNNSHNIIPSGYHTLPNRPRGRGRLQYNHETLPGNNFRSRTPDFMRSPSTSRPQTPTGDNQRNDFGSTDHHEVRRFPTKYSKSIPEENSVETENREYAQSKLYQGNRGSHDYQKNREEMWSNKRDERSHMKETDGNRRDYGQERYRDRETSTRDQHDRSKETIFRDNQYRIRDRDRNRETASRDFHDLNRNRNTPVRDNKDWERDRYKNRDRGRETPGRDNRGNLNRNEHNKDRRQGDRRNGNRRSRSKDFKRRDSIASVSSRNEDYGCQSRENLNVDNKIEVEFEVEEPVASHEDKVLVDSSAFLDIGTHLNWSEEVELNYKLESGNVSDAPTRSSSVTSLQDASMKSLPPQNTNNSYQDSRRRKHRKKSRNRSTARDNSHSSMNNRSRKNSTTSIGSRDDFKVPQSYPSRRRPSEDRYDSNYESFHGSSRNPSRDCSWDRQRSKTSSTENWREEIVRSRQNSERETKNNLEDIKNMDANTKKAGVIVLPQQKVDVSKATTSGVHEQPKLPETRRSPSQQKSLFDPNNPAKPIVIKSPCGRVSAPGFSSDVESSPPQMYTTDQFGNIRPVWYDEASKEFQSCHFPNLLQDIRRADTELQVIIQTGLLLVKWELVDELRKFLKRALEYLLCKSIKFCQTENIEQHIWKISYHNIIEIARKALKNDVESREKYKAFLLYLIDEGTKYYEGLLVILEETYEFKINDYLKDNNGGSHRGLGLVGLALISAQKLFLYLGDLGRYREEVNETSNYGKCRQWYIKSHEINPKNGKPYNQLALLAVYTKRKLDAVYYYMRSLMSSNPVPSAKEKLVELFYDIRKKYEQGEKKRREERLERQRALMKQKEFEEPGNAPGSLRKEIWIHPEGGRRVHRTTQASLEQDFSEEEDLESLNSVEVNKRFVISYLHVHGKLITKIGMETFQETSMQMLKEFRALLQHSPVPLPCNRFLQLLALNMFAIESTQLKDPQLQSQQGYRSEMQERALIVSLQMFNLILERCVTILDEHLSSGAENARSFVPPDAEVMLPAIKIWCDWMLCHTNVWNPPPSTQDYRVGPPGDAWSRLATLMNFLEQFDQSPSETFRKDSKIEGFELVKLPEDSVLSGFTPLMYTAQEDLYAPKELETDRAHFSLRLSKLLFFGTEYLCGLEPPVLKLEIEDGVREYVSVVCLSNSRDSPPEELPHNNEIVLESFSSEEEGDNEDNDVSNSAPSEIRSLLTRKVELEKRKRSQELHLQRVKKILSQSVVSVHMEVRPKYLVPDTNCFIDHLKGIKTIAQAHSYTFMVPIVVLSELEGLSRGGKAPMPSSRHSQDPEHIKKVANSAREALDFLKTRHSSVKCVTTKGAILPSMTFSTEDDTSWDSGFKNDDKILTTCLVLCKNHKEQAQENSEGEPRRLEREVVLLTEDRNLRVKAYARDVPVRELPDFMRWSALG